MTTRLKNIFGLSILLFIAHGVEEFLTHFYETDTWDQAIFGSLFGNLSTHGATFATFQVMFWLLLAISFLLLLGERWQIRVLAIAGVVYIYEFHHIVKAVSEWGYYPGLITALAFPFVAILFWKEWFKVYKNHNESPRGRALPSVAPLLSAGYLGASLWDILGNQRFPKPFLSGDPRGKAPGYRLRK